MIGRPEYTLTLPPPCPTNRDHLKDWGTDYNARRPHTSLQGLTPMEFATPSVAEHNQKPLTYR